MTKKSHRPLPAPNPDVIVDLPVEQIMLDSDNPRLAWRVDGDSQETLLKLLWTKMAVDEVAFSIANNGFFRSEPLFVVVANPDEKDPDKRRYLTIEGNRRLAAVRLLRDKRLREKVGANELPEIEENRRAELDKLPTIIYPDRKSLWTTVGFRHINGIKGWDSFSKAKYVAEVYENYGIPLDEIAERIGDLHSTVKRIYRGYKILLQAEEKTSFDKEDRARNRFSFSHLYTATDQREFQEFLGITSDGSLKPEPVPDSKVAELEELVIWLYGKKSADIDPVVRTQNPDLNTLRKVIGKPESLAVLRKTRRLEVAHDVAIGDEQRFRNAISNAKLELQNAKATVTTGYKGEDDSYETIQDVIIYAESIENEMEARRAEAGIDHKRRANRKR